MHSTNYFNTLIEVAEDCPVTVAEVPPQKEEKTVANLQYNMIHKHPYTYTSDDVLFSVYVERHSIAKKDYKTERENFSPKGKPVCEPLPYPNAMVGAFTATKKESWP